MSDPASVEREAASAEAVADLLMSEMQPSILSHYHERKLELDDFVNLLKMGAVAMRELVCRTHWLHSYIFGHLPMASISTSRGPGVIRTRLKISD